MRRATTTRGRSTYRITPSSRSNSKWTRRESMHAGATSSRRSASSTTLTAIQQRKAKIVIMAPTSKRHQMPTTMEVSSLAIIAEEHQTQTHSINASVLTNSRSRAMYLITARSPTCPQSLRCPTCKLPQAVTPTCKTCPLSKDKGKGQSVIQYS